MKTNWRLPKGVDELLPPDAWELEALRRRVLDLFVCWGFDYIEPPVIEYLDALLVASGEDLDLQTLKVVDQVTGKQLGIRADMTSQAVRIDAHSLPTDDIQRLCYAGPVVFANPQISQASRVPMKAGAELFGAPGLRADAEVVSLMLNAVATAGIDKPVLLLGHMAIYRSLVAALDEATTAAPGFHAELFARVQRKSQADIRNLLPDTDIAGMLADLPMLMGGVDAIDEARSRLAGAPAAVARALDELQELAQMIDQDHAGVDIRIDVSELSGYGYHNGPVFAVYHPQHGSALAQGGRYDGVGEVFGRARPATGFDMNLKALLGSGAPALAVVFAPYVAAAERAGQVAAISALRQQGVRVRVALRQDEPRPAECVQELQQVGQTWQIVTV